MDVKLAHTRSALFAEIDETLQSASEHSRARIFDGTVRLFLKHAGAFDPATVALFDDLFMRLIDGVENGVLAAVSLPLARIPHPPVKLMRQLAHHACAAVAAPVLMNATCLEPADVLAIAKSCGPEPLLAICQRAVVDANLAAALIARDDRHVIDTLAMNPGAHYRIDDFGGMLGRATADERARVQIRMPVEVRNAEFGPAMTACTMIDISQGGAKLQLAVPMPFPQTFILQFAHVEWKRVQCRKIWQRDNITGLLFKSPLMALWGGTAAPLANAPPARP